MAFWKTSDGRSGTCVDSKGIGKPQLCNYNFKESGNIKIRAALHDHDSHRIVFGGCLWTPWVHIG